MFSPEINPGLGRSGRITPQLETLEDRCCPSTVAFQNHILTLTGDANASTMIVRDDGHGDVKATLNGHLTSFTGVQQILINSKTANDKIDYALTGALTTSEQLRLSLGSGNDQVHLDFTKGVSAPSLKINVDGGAGNQSIGADFGAITNTQLQLAANLGNGWDHFSASFHGNLAGTAHADVNVHGGHGIEGVNVQANGNIGAAAQLSVEAYLGTSNNTAHVNYTGKLDGRLAILEQGGPSWNWLETHVNLTPGSTGSVYVRELGGPSSDLLILTINTAGSQPRSIDALLNGGTGVNTSMHTANVRAINAGF